ncbi:Hypothetical protein HDN1F_32620 [gamma proteobacterium HdN1]|nr:Hypothetical protein HDN1F_32620 [gamma proteobacterium HdN1]
MSTLSSPHSVEPKQRPRYALIAMIGLIIAGTLYYLATHYAFRSVWVDIGPTPEARNNMYFGAQKFLRMQGYQVSTTGLLQEALDHIQPHDTIFLFYDHGMEYEALSENVSRWVKAGGHIVLIAHYLWEEDEQSSGDTFLDQLGVRQYIWPRESASSDSESSADSENNDVGEADSEEADATRNSTITTNESSDLQEPSGAQCEPITSSGETSPDQLTLMPLAPSGHPLQLAFESSYHIEDESGTASNPLTAPPVHMLDYSYGAGHITVLTDYFLFNDHNIGSYDHAYFLWWLAGNSNQVWLVYDKYSETLFTLLWESAPYLCFGVGVLLVLWLLHRGLRIGPIRTEPIRARRQLLEHIDASARFIWQNHEHSILLDEARQPVLSKCQIVNDKPVFSKQITRALEQLKLPEARLLWALTTPKVRDELEFVELIRILQQVRTRL